MDDREVPSGRQTITAGRRVVKKRRGLILLFAAVVVAGVLLWQGLSNATVYFKTVDEAVAAVKG